MAKQDSDPTAYTFCETIAAYVWHIRKIGKSGTHPSGAGPAKMTKTLCGQQPAWDLTGVEVNRLTSPEAAEKMTARHCNMCWPIYVKRTKRWERD